MAEIGQSQAPVLSGVLGQISRAPKDPRRYSRFVQVLRRALPLIAIALLVVFAGWPILQQREDARQAVIVMGEIGEVSDDLKMIQPQYTGTDAFGRSYSVTAESAIPDAANPTEVRLSTLSAIIRDPSGRMVAVTAEEGVYYTQRGVILVNGDVRVGASGGFEAAGREAVLDLNRSRLTSRFPLKGKSPWGTLEANSLTAEQETGIVRFDGGVRVVIEKLPDTAIK